jgi:putative membrane protein
MRATRAKENIPPKWGAVPAGWQDGRMKVLLKVAITAVALWVAVAVVPGIEVRSHSMASKIGTLLVVALIFGLINAVLKPIVKTVGCLFYVLTLGLISLLVNGLLLLLASWIAGQLDVPFHIRDLGAAVLGALIVGIVGWLLSLIVDRDTDEQR